MPGAVGAIAAYFGTGAAAGAIGVSSIAGKVLVGAAIGALAGGATAAIMGQDVGKGALSGALAGAVSGGIVGVSAGSAAGAAGGSSMSSLAADAGALGGAGMSGSQALGAASATNATTGGMAFMDKASNWLGLGKGATGAANTTPGMGGVSPDIQAIINSNQQIAADATKWNMMGKAAETGIAGLMSEDPEDAAEREYRYRKMLADNDKVQLSKGFADRMAKYQPQEGIISSFADRIKKRQGVA